MLVSEEDVVRLICGTTLQSGRSLEEKQTFYDNPRKEWDMHSEDDLILLGRF